MCSLLPSALTWALTAFIGGNRVRLVQQERDHDPAHQVRLFELFVVTRARDVVLFKFDKVFR